MVSSPLTLFGSRLRVTAFRVVKTMMATTTSAAITMPAMAPPLNGPGGGDGDGVNDGVARAVGTAIVTLLGGATTVTFVVLLPVARSMAAMATAMSLSSSARPAAVDKRAIMAAASALARVVKSATTELPLPSSVTMAAGQMSSASSMASAVSDALAAAAIADEDG